MSYLVIFFLMKALRPDGFGVDTPLWETVNLLVLVIGCLHYVPIRFLKLYYTPLKNPAFVWFFAFVLLFLVSLWRSNDFVSSGVGIFKDTVTLLLLLLFLYLYQQHRFRRELSFSRPIIVGLVHVLGIFCLMNLVSIVINPMFGSGDFTTLSLFGLQGKRIVFSMYPDAHAVFVGIMGGYLLVMNVDRSLLGTTLMARVMRWVYLATGLIVVLISDSRSMLFSALLSVLVVILLRVTHKLTLAKYAVWLLPFSHILFLLSLQFAAGFSMMQSISRDSSDLATGNSRKFIYQAATNELSDFKPIHLIGYGEYGTYAAGLTRYYMKLFGYTDEEQILNSSVAHNTALQVIFDIGYLGLLMYLLLIFSAMAYAYKLYQAGYQEYLALLYFFLFNIVMGVATTRYGNYHEAANQLFIAFCFITFNTYNLSTYSRHHAKPRAEKRAHAVG